MTILPMIQDGIERARRGELSLYWQRDIEREYRGQNPTGEERQAYAELQKLLCTVPQWSDQAALDAEIEEQSGRVMFCYYFQEHNSMAQITQDCNAAFDVSYVLDSNISPEERKSAAQEVQRLLADQIRQWDIPLLKSTVPEKMKYSYLEEAASHLMQVLNDPENITG